MEKIGVVGHVTEYEDIIYDDPDDYITDESSEESQANTLEIVVTEEENRSKLESLEALIEQLPKQFPDAVDIIRDEISPLLVDCNAGVKDHYIKVIKKKTDAASIKSVSLIIDEAIERINTEETAPEKNELDEIREDPEVQKKAEKISQDPMLLKNKIDLVGQLGVIGERKNIALYMTVIDSCLLQMGSIDWVQM